MLVHIFCQSERWKVLLDGLKVSIHSRTSFILSLVGIFFNFVMPGGVGGDVVKSTIIERANQNSKGRIYIGSFFDRVTGFWGMCFLASLTSLFYLEEFKDNSDLLGMVIILTLISASSVVFFYLVNLFKEKILALIKNESTNLFKRFMSFCVDQSVCFITIPVKKHFF
ncbi:MAG: flippase-like domain-containing protein, partial [Campylobacterales bacterium]|nr:flippase-like domain-containing protein [Campylobacterales bacterium]